MFEFLVFVCGSNGADSVDDRCGTWIWGSCEALGCLLLLLEHAVEIKIYGITSILFSCRVPAVVPGFEPVLQHPEVMYVVAIYTAYVVLLRDLVS